MLDIQSQELCFIFRNLTPFIFPFYFPRTGIIYRSFWQISSRRAKNVKRT